MLSQKYEIGHNLLITDNKLIAVFAIDPVDVTLLPEQDRLSFFSEMRHMLNSLREGTMQLIMRTRKTSSDDLLRHFQSTLEATQLGDKELWLRNNYVSELTRLLQTCYIPHKEYFFVISQEKNSKHLESCVSILEKNTNRIVSHLVNAGVGVWQLKDQELKDLLISINR